MNKSVLPRKGLVWFYLSFYNDKQSAPVYEESIGHHTIHFESEVSTWQKHYENLAKLYEKHLNTYYPALGYKVIVSSHYSHKL